MVLYLSIIFIAMVIISLFNILVYPESFFNFELWIVLAVTLSVVVEIALSGISALIFEKLPAKCYNLNCKFFTVSKKEQKFYEKIGIKRWKDKIWELGALGGFRKNKINEPNSSTYLHKFMIENCKGMIGHIVSVIIGILVIFVLPLKYWWRIGLPVALVGMFLNFLPVLVLRYNLPKLDIAFRRAKRLEERKEIELKN